jgi:DNA-binding transcriptional regulator/RsmH inhibitor MraZ
MLVPADVRKLMQPQVDGEGFYVIIGRNHKPWLFAERYYDDLLARESEKMNTQQELRPDKRRLREWQRRFGMARRIAWDAQGRILFPEMTLRRTETGRDVTLVGVRNHLELWNRAEWEAEYNAILNEPDDEFDEPDEDDDRETKQTNENASA